MIVTVRPFPPLGAALLLLLIILWVTLIVRGAICRKHRVVEKTPTIINATPARDRGDAMHGTPPGDGGDHRGGGRGICERKNALSTAQYDRRLETL